MTTMAGKLGLGERNTASEIAFIKKLAKGGLKDKLLDERYKAIKRIYVAVKLLYGKGYHETALQRILNSCVYEINRVQGSKLSFKKTKGGKNGQNQKR